MNQQYTSHLINIPQQFFEVEYKGSRIPGTENPSNFKQGANCQVFAYELLKHNGINIPNFRSSELWEDTIYTEKVEIIKPLDILLYNSENKAYGAHVGVSIGNNMLIHLSAENNKAEIISQEDMLRKNKYCIFIGAKRVNTI